MTAIKGLLVLVLTHALAHAPALSAEASRARQLDGAIAEINAAELALRQAEDRLRQAVEPLPGERAGNVDGGSRLRPEYFERQQARAAEVDAARARLEKAHRLRNELRD